jgi:hypothetical protein
MLSPHVGGQVFNQIGTLQSYKKTLHSRLFPALSIVEAQLVDLPLVIGDFIDQLDTLFPFARDQTGDLRNATLDGAFYDSFVSTISDDSPSGPQIDSDELQTLISRTIFVIK